MFTFSAFNILTIHFSCIASYILLSYFLLCNPGGRLQISIQFLTNRLVFYDNGFFNDGSAR